MKEIFIQFRQWIVKHRKKIIYGALALFIFQIGFLSIGEFGVENQVFAADQDADIKSKAQEKINTLSFIQKMIYILVYPMLVVAGTLVDNSMVYGEVFHFDVVLWELWNVMRNLANFTLGFIFIYKIFKYLIGEQKSGEIKKLLISLLIAGIGIQASWFIMAALIDMSTILTYGVGGLPITVLGENGDNVQGNTGQTGEGGTSSQGICADKDSKGKYNPYVYKTLITVDVKEEDTSAIRWFLTNTSGSTHTYISECASFKYTGAHEILMGPKVIYYYDAQKNEVKLTDQGVCHYGGQVYQFAGGISFLQTEFDAQKNGCNNEDTCKNKQKDYTSSINKKIEELRSLGSGLARNIEQGVLLEEGNAHITGGMQGALRTGQYTDCAKGLDVDNQMVGKRTGTQRLQDTLDNKSYLGVFTQLYSSLMSSGRNILGSTGDSRFLNLLAIMLELGHLIAISIPLIVVGILFMIRIGILWMAIIMSPFIAILTAFEDDIGKFVFEKMKDLDILKYLKLTNLIGIIFSPAVICLAISLSTVFVTIISNIDFSESMGSSGNEILGGLIKINIANVAAKIWSFLKAAFGAAITWFIVWAAIKSSKLGEMKFVDSLKNLAETSIGTIPVIPVPTKDGGVQLIGANTAFGLNGNPGMISEMSNQITREFKGQEAKGIDALFGNGTSEEDARKARVKTYTERITGMIPQGDWTTQTITIGEKGSEKEDMNFGSLNESEKESVIEAINKISNADKRKAFGDNQPGIVLSGKTYKFQKKTLKNDKGEKVVLNKYMTDDEYNKYKREKTLTEDGGEG